MHPSIELTPGDFEAARERVATRVVRTPLVRLQVDAPCEIYLKLENLQPIGSFKLRGASNAMALAGREKLSDGVVTASAGNMAQGVAWVAREWDIACRVVVPDHAPRAKLDAIERLGGAVLPVPFEDWWRTLERRGHPDAPGYFIHPVSDAAVIAGNGTIGFEILEDLPDVDTVLIPYGGGGLSTGIASVVRAAKPDTRLYACEVETAAPLSASLAAGEPVEIDYQPSFVDGIGGRGLLKEMWPLVSTLLDGAVVVELDQVADAIRTLATRANVIAEGAGAASVAAASSGRFQGDKVVCVISGGNIDAAKLVEILQGSTP